MLQANLGQQFLDRFNSSLSVEITFQVMTVTGQSAGCHYTISPSLKGMKHLDDVQTAGAGHLNNLEVGWVLGP